MRLSIFLVVIRCGLACKYGINFRIKICTENFLIRGVTIANQARL